MEERSDNFNGYSCGSYPAFLEDEEDEIKKFIEKNTFKMNYARLKRTEAAKKYGIEKNIPYAEALERFKKSKIFGNASSLGGIMWIEKINDESEIKKCEKRKENSYRSLKKINESESESENVTLKIKKEIKKLNSKILELEKKEKEIKLEIEKAKSVKLEFIKILK